MSPNCYCPLCNLIVAPVASDKLEFRGKTAHEGCVRRRSFDGVVSDAEAFLARHGGGALGDFRKRAPSARRPRDLAKLLAGVLCGLLDAAVNGRGGGRRSIAAFAERAGAALFCDIDLGDAARPRSAAPRATVFQDEEALNASHPRT